MGAVTTSVDVSQRLLQEAINELAVVGPYRFSVGDVTTRAEVTQAMANYYFGGRWGLIEAAVLEAYTEYVKLMMISGVNESDPVEQLLAWAVAQIEWTASHPGIAVVLNYQNLVPEIESLNNETRSQLTVLGTRHFDFVTNLVRNGKTVRGIQNVNEVTLRTKTAVFMWTILGLSTWYSGRHIPTTPSLLENLPFGIAGVRSLIDEWLLNPTTTRLGASTTTD